jgi:hypothetical protein
MPATGVWAVLSAHHEKWTGQRVVLADYDEDQRRLGLCVADFGSV